MQNLIISTTYNATEDVYEVYYFGYNLAHFWGVNGSINNWTLVSDTSMWWPIGDPGLAKFSLDFHDPDNFWFEINIYEIERYYGVDTSGVISSVLFEDKDYNIISRMLPDSSLDDTVTYSYPDPYDKITEDEFWIWAPRHNETFGGFGYSTWPPVDGTEGVVYYFGGDTQHVFWLKVNESDYPIAQFRYRINSGSWRTLSQFEEPEPGVRFYYIEITSTDGDISNGLNHMFIEVINTGGAVGRTVYSIYKDVSSPVISNLSVDAPNSNIYIDSLSNIYVNDIEDLEFDMEVSD